MHKKKLIVAVGPTAVGKTMLAINLARSLGSEIVSADARQVYKEMNIGTAKPTASERAMVPHHLVDFVPITRHYTAADFEEDGLDVLEKLFSKYDYVVMTGGSGLYIDAVCRGMVPLPIVPPAIKSEVNGVYEKYGLEPLLLELESEDPTYYAKVDRKNPRRVLHAISVLRASGKPYSYYRTRKVGKRPFDVIKIGLTRDRAEQHNRMNQRVDIMLQKGLLEEVKSLYDYRGYKALDTIGYRELFAFIEGKVTLEEAIRWIKIHTHQYAKRQMTWFRKDPSIQWFVPTEQEAIVDYVKSALAFSN